MRPSISSPCPLRRRAWRLARPRALIGRLGYGELRTRTVDDVHRYYVDGGFAQVRDDVVTVLTNRALPASQSTRPPRRASWSKPRRPGP